MIPEEFTPDEFQLMIERREIGVVIGVIRDDMSIRSKPVEPGSEDTHEKYGWDGDDDHGWRYKPQNNTIYWWGKPSDDLVDEVIHHLRTKYGVKQHPHHTDLNVNPRFFRNAFA